MDVAGYNKIMVAEGRFIHSSVFFRLFIVTYEIKKNKLLSSKPEYVFVF